MRPIVNFTIVQQASFYIDILLSILHHDKQDALSEFQRTFQPVRNTDRGCEAGLVRGVAWRETLGPDRYRSFGGSHSVPELVVPHSELERL